MTHILSIWRQFPKASTFPFVAILILFLVSVSVFPVSAADDDDDDDDQGGHTTLAVINGLEDIFLGSWQGNGDLRSYTDHCVASTTGHYSIIATGDGPGGSYQLSSGAATLPFRLFYRDKKNAAYVEIPAAIPVANFKTGKKPKKCEKQKQRLEVRLQEADMAQAPAGAYSGYLIVTVTPL